MRYIAKPGGWFDAGSEVFLIADCQEVGGIFKGYHLGKLDEELCAWDEFDQIDG